MLEGSLPKILLSNLPASDEVIEVFVPCMQVHKSGRPHVYKLMEGYVFISDGLPEMEYLRLENTPYIESVMTRLTSEGIRTCQLVNDSSINDLKEKMLTLSGNTFQIGDPVKVLNGSYAKMIGWVAETGESHSTVFFSLRSARIFKSIKNTSLEPHEDTERMDFNILDFPTHARQRSLFDLKGALSEEG